MAKKNHSDIIDIRGTLKSYISRWYLFVISIFGCLFLAFFYLYIHKTNFGVRANILVKQEDANPMASFGSLGDIFGSNGSVDDEIFVLSSHQLYRDVVRDLGLNKMHYVRTGFLRNELAYPEYPIEVFTQANITDTLKEVLAFKVKINDKGLASVRIKDSNGVIEKVSDIKLPHTFNTPYGEFTVDRTENYPEGEDLTSTIILTGYHAAAENLAESVVSDIANKRSNVILLAYDTPYPELGETVLQSIIDKYNDRGINEKRLQGQKTAEFINERLALLVNDLDTAEINIQRYKENNGIVDVYTETKYQTTKRAETEAKLIEAETYYEILKMTLDFISDPKNRFELIPISGGSESLQTFISHYNHLVIKRKDMLRTVKEDNNAVAKLSSEIESYRANIISTVNQNLSNSQVKVKDLRNQLGSASSKLSNIPRQERDAVDLERQRRIKQELVMFLRKRQEENALMMANAVPKGAIVDAPYTLAKPLGMGKLPILLIAFFIGLCLPPVYIYLIKLIRNRIESRDEIDNLTEVPILGEMCTDDSGRSMVVGPTDTSSATELFRLMRANLLFVINGEKDKVVLMTSSKSGEGKSFISINLAASLALTGRKVLLIGMDIRAPRLAEYIGIHPRAGLTQYLSSSDLALETIINRSPLSDNPTLDVIVAGPIPPNPAELLISKRVDQMFETLRDQYDYIIVDTAPVGMVSDTFTLDRIADATIYVTRLNYTTTTDVKFIDNIYEEKRLKKLSIVINGVKGKKTYGYQAAKGHSSM